MNHQTWVVVLAAAIALIMAIKPEMCIPNPKHRTKTFIHGIKYIGMSVAIVLLIWLAANALR